MCREACSGVLTFLGLIYLFVLINLRTIGKLFRIFSLWEDVGGPEKDRVLCWWWGGGGGLHVLSPRILLANWISLGIMVTRWSGWHRGYYLQVSPPSRPHWLPAMLLWLCSGTCRDVVLQTAPVQFLLLVWQTGPF